MAKYGLLAYRGCRNLGDEIQSIAAQQFLPRVDRYLDRDYLNTYSGLSDPHFLIMNGWFTTLPDNWPPSHQIAPCFVAFHVADPKIIDSQFVDYYRRYAPIGCRDITTAHLLRSMGVDAYCSGCLTLTLKNTFQNRTDAVYIVDVPAALQELIPPQIMGRALQITHTVKRAAAGLGALATDDTMESQDSDAALRTWKFRRARELLERYMQAELVITTRLHCALPCIAFGTPVVVLSQGHMDRRWWGVAKSLKVYTPGTIQNLNWNHIPVMAQPDTQELEARIRQAVSDFAHGAVDG